MAIAVYFVGQDTLVSLPKLSEIMKVYVSMLQKGCGGGAKTTNKIIQRMEDYVWSGLRPDHKIAVSYVYPQLCCGYKIDT